MPGTGKPVPAKAAIGPCLKMFFYLPNNATNPRKYFLTVGCCCFFCCFFNSIPVTIKTFPNYSKLLLFEVKL